MEEERQQKLKQEEHDRAKRIEWENNIKMMQQLMEEKAKKM